MPYENTGKTIKRINVNKKNVVIFFKDGDKLEISQEAYASCYLYVGKSLSFKDIQNLKNLSSLNSLLKYSMTLLTRSHYSEYKIREKLYNKSASKGEVDQIIKILKNYDLIDDSAFAMDLYEYGNEKNLGKNRIIQMLYNKGIFEKEINKLSFPHNKEISKAKANLPILERKYAKLSNDNKKKHIYSSLLSLGFENDVVLSVINNIKEDNDKKELEKLDIDFNKAITRLKNRYEGKQLKEKLVVILKNKGYKISHILKKWEAYNYENDF